MRSTPNREKLSTTVSADGYAYLQNLVKNGLAASIAEAVDRSIDQARRADNRARLAKDSAAYFEGLSPDAVQEEKQLESALGQVIDEIDFGD